MKCIHCGSDKFEEDTARGTIYCTLCGTLQEENTIVSSLNFTEENGASYFTGQMIKITDTFNKVGSTFITSNNTHILNMIRNICSPLGLNEDHALKSFRWYKLSLQHNMTRGRSLLYTLSACIYIVCRQDQTPHMLIDFSVLLRVDVFRIGRIFVKLVTMMNIQIPLTDPSLYLHRFIKKLNFNVSGVEMMALRLVSRMKRDWIVVGRRPNNVCGAALVIASRILGDEKSVEEVARIVHVSANTINRRINEIKETSTAELTVNEFQNLWLEKEDDPPACKERITEKQQKPREFNEVKYNEIKCNEIKSDQFRIEEMYKKPIDEMENDSNELNNFILSEEEAKIREEMWEEMYGEYMKEKETRVVKIRKPHVKRKKKEFKNYNDAVESVVKDTKLSSKINYKVIEELFKV
ncbi:Transcription factor IIIB 60 kDa subunit [Astathelohania contejeani]|uniref:B-related factor 1 n=1 Tax=Astathelohania contejeani TaxID=164912 RepID=A0ABQ7HYH1_9MICR|nr:Transcription factor IIIB 60 kDa subunit [Thelohania contejeani]